MVESNPIKKEDPNAIPGQKASDKKKELIAERVKESNEEKPTSECELIVTPYFHLITTAGNKNSNSSSSISSNKKMSWDEIEQVMNKKSSHDWEAKEVCTSSYYDDSDWLFYRRNGQERISIFSNWNRRK